MDKSFTHHSRLRSEVVVEKTGDEHIVRAWKREKRVGREKKVKDNKIILYYFFIIIATRSILIANLDLVWYCCDFLRAAELSGLSKSYSQKDIVVLFGKII